MKLTDEQNKAIIEDTASRFAHIIDDIDCSEFDLYEDDYGRAIITAAQQ